MGIFMKTLGERVKEERKKRRWSQADLGVKVGVSQAAISEIERDVPKSSLKDTGHLPRRRREMLYKGEDEGPLQVQG